MHLRSANLLQFINDTKRRYNGFVTQSKFRVGLIQMACSLDPNENLAKAEWRIREAAAKGAQIICVQELFRSQYFCQTEDLSRFDLAETIPGPTTESFSKLAAELNGDRRFDIRAAHGGGVSLRRWSSMPAANCWGLSQDAPTILRFYEKYYSRQATSSAVSTRYVAPLICWVQWYPEGARLALGGAQILFYPTASDSTIPAPRRGTRTMRGRPSALIIANGVYVAAVNAWARGPAGRPPVPGGLLDPQGRMLTKAGEAET
jgi:N-carbamoylputrescine amidase